MRKHLATALIVGAASFGLASASFAMGVPAPKASPNANIHGTTNSAIGGTPGSGGATGTAHRLNNQALKAGTPTDTTGAVTGGANRSATGTINSTLGSKAAKTGVPGANGAAHSGANAANPVAKPLR